MKGQKTNIKNLSQRIQLYARHWHEKKNGIGSFIYGRDYAPYLNVEESYSIDKGCMVKKDYEMWVFKE